MYITNEKEYKRLTDKYSRLFDRVIERTGRYSYEAITEALGPDGSAEYHEIGSALVRYDDRKAFYACLLSGDYRS